MDHETMLKRAARRAPGVLRACVGLVFVVAGASKLIASDETARLLAEHGVPWPTVMGAALAAFEVLAGALLVTGRYVRVVAAVLVLHVLALSIVIHLPFGLSAGAARTQWVNVAFDLLAVLALYTVATAHPRSRPPALGAH